MEKMEEKMKFPFTLIIIESGCRKFVSIKVKFLCLSKSNFLNFMNFTSDIHFIVSFIR